MILVLSVNKNTIISGSKDSSVIIWNYEDNELKFFKKIIVDNSIRSEIQSLDIRNNNLLIGTRTGSVF